MIATRHHQPNVIVTGSSGLIGAALVGALRHRYQVIGFDNQGRPHAPPEIECVCVDLTDPRSIRAGLRRVHHAYGDHLAAVVHLAAYYDFSGEPSDLYEKVTVRGTQRLLQRLQSFHVEQFIYSSSMLVHRPAPPGRPITEKSPLEAKWDYPKSKIDAEQVIHSARGRIPAAILRIAGVYTDVCDSIPIAHQIQRIAERRLTSRVYPGDVSHGQAFVHCQDLVRAVELAITKRAALADDEVFLIGEPETFSYEALQRALAKLIHDEDDWSTRSMPKSVAEAGAWVSNAVPGIEEPFIKPWMIEMADDHYELDITRARERLGWEPQHRLIRTLPAMIEHLRADPKKWYERHGLPWPGSIDVGLRAAAGSASTT